MRGNEKSKVAEARTSKGHCLSTNTTSVTVHRSSDFKKVTGLRGLAMIRGVETSDVVLMTDAQRQLLDKNGSKITGVTVRSRFCVIL